MTETILVIAHGHREFSTGGAEVAAHQLFTSLRESQAADNVILLARHEGRSLSGLISPLRSNEYLWSTGISNWFKFQSGLRHSVFGAFRDFLERVRPDVVFVHHYANIGLEMLREIRRTCPDARLILTFHEYYAMCSNGGQMVKAGTNELCYSAMPEACTVCFPERSEEDFWLRKHFIRRHFDAVDRFIAPSEFLRQRYIDWGIAPDRITVIENGQPTGERLPPRPLAGDGRRNRFAFFGQVTPFKGVDVLLAALNNLSRAQRRNLHLEIHGANLEKQDDVFRARIEALRRPLMEEGVLHWPGAYHRDDLPRRMARIDWVVVPSVWWENSPVVIQEARRFGRPILCSNIGGMAEHVRDGVDGLHVGVGNATDWGESLLAATDSDRWDRLVQSLRPPVPVATAARQYLEWALDDTPRRAPELPRVISGRV
ncbi:glycosyltransferase family 4 protein [Xanthobacter sp. YC-JY1]|uniref:glycosyltransferase family 4 protein n=1 Tax=Xanthobacter sp. YC-JY1 TaxID=2419844 RepID=UPI001F187436|nr:glycosyltransferase family 4 protein [Xanthobacter sp. YC-JY1]UJX45048.1 glycosyltransferase [Xanthobacter sp. YC-JY1]